MLHATSTVVVPPSPSGTTSHIVHFELMHVPSAFAPLVETSTEHVPASAHVSNCFSVSLHVESVQHAVTSVEHCCAMHAPHALVVSRSWHDVVN